MKNVKNLLQDCRNREGVMDKIYSVDLSTEEWNDIITMLWISHNFNLSDKIEKCLLKRYPDIALSIRKLV